MKKLTCLKSGSYASPKVSEPHALLIHGEPIEVSDEFAARLIDRKAAEVYVAKTDEVVEAPAETEEKPEPAKKISVKKAASKDK